MSYKSGFHLYKTFEIAKSNLHTWKSASVISILEVIYNCAVAQDEKQIVALKVKPIKEIIRYNTHTHKIVQESKQEKLLECRY